MTDVTPDKKPMPLIATERDCRRLLGLCWAAATGEPIPVILDPNLLIGRIEHLRGFYEGTMGLLAEKEQ